MVKGEQGPCGELFQSLYSPFLCHRTLLDFSPSVISLLSSAQYILFLQDLNLNLYLSHFCQVKIFLPPHQHSAEKVTIMQSKALVLLAVHLNLIAAGLIRDIRFSIADTTSSDYSITSTIALKAAQTPAADGQIESTAPAKGQFGSVPAFGSGPGAATTEQGKSQPATTKVNSYPTSAPSVKDYHDESIQSIAAGPSSNSGLSNSALTVKQQSAIQSTVSLSASVGTPSAKASAISVSSQQTAAASTEALKGKKGNTAMAAAFNSVFTTLNAQSPCNANNKDEVVACINGQFGQCSNGKYTLVQCAQGQSCYALPLTGSTQGITVQCASKQDANQRLGQGSTAPAAASPSQSSASPVSQQPSAAKPTIAPVASVAQSPTAGSAQSYQSMSASHIPHPSAMNSTTTSAAGVIQSIAAGSTSVSQPPTDAQSSMTTPVSSAASTESTTIQSKPSSAAPTTPKDTQSAITSKDTPSATSTPTTTPSPTVSSASSTKPSAASTSDDGQITVIPIPI